MNAKSPELAPLPLQRLAQATASLEARLAPGAGPSKATDGLEFAALRELRQAHLNLSMQGRQALDLALPFAARKDVGQNLGAHLVELGLLAEQLASHAKGFALFVGANNISLGAEKLGLALKSAGLTRKQHVYRQKLRSEASRFDGQLPVQRNLPPLKVAATPALAQPLPAAQTPAALYIEPERSYLLGPALTQHQGSYGEIFRIERLEGGRTAALLAKVQRSVADLFVGDAAAASTIAQDLPSMLARAADSERSLGRIERLVQERYALVRLPSGPLRELGFEQGSVKLVDHFVDPQGRYYQIMHAMSGDLVDLSTHTLLMQREFGLGEQLIADLRLSVATQSILQLEALHGQQRLWSRDAGVMHNDLKLSNMVFNRRGSVRLIDFDEVAALSALHGSKEPFKRVGTLTSPEMELSLLRRRSGRLDAAHDVFAWGATMLDFALGEGRNTLFLLDNIGTGREQIPGLSMATYVAWFERTVQPHKNIDWPIHLPSQQETQAIAERSWELLGADKKRRVAQIETRVGELARNYARMFNERNSHDPRLMALIMRSALHPHPRRRSSAAHLAQRLLQQVGQLDSTRRAAVVEHMDQVASLTEIED